MTPDSKPARRPLSEIWKAGLIGAGVAAIINVVLYLLGQALGSFPATALTPMGRPVDVVGTAVVSVLGVGNKAADYDDKDEVLVSYVADLIWTIVEQKRLDEEVRRLNGRLAQQANTDELTGLANRRAFFARGNDEDLGRTEPPKARPPGRCAQHDEQRVARRPAERLRARRRPRLEQERVADERQHRREVRQREQPVGARSRVRAREPRLHQRARRRQQEVGQADRRRQHPEDQQRRALVAGRLPVHAGDDR